MSNRHILISDESARDWGEAQALLRKTPRVVTVSPLVWLAALKAMVLNDRHTYRDCHKAALAAIAKAEQPA